MWTVMEFSREQLREIFGVPRFEWNIAHILSSPVCRLRNEIIGRPVLEIDFGHPRLVEIVEEFLEGRT